MANDKDLSRRGFVKLCTTALVAAGAHRNALAVPEGRSQTYERVQLVHPEGRPLRLAEIVEGEAYVFHYPYAVTPCFLIDLGRETATASKLKTESGTSYDWRGGIGPERSVVAFSAICAHRMTHPAKHVSFINYRHERVRFKDSDERTMERDGVIFCCSERSVYDPRQGCRVLGGPAKQPLAAIELAWSEADDTLYATGSYGGEMYERFFEKFGSRLALEYRTQHIKEPVRESTTVMPMDEYSSNTVSC